MTERNNCNDDDVINAFRWTGSLVNDLHSAWEANMPDSHTFVRLNIEERVILARLLRNLPLNVKQKAFDGYKRGYRRQVIK